MASGQAIAYVTKVVAAGAGATGTHTHKGMIQFLAAQVDVLVDLMLEMRGVPSPKMVLLILAKKGLSTTNLSTNYGVNCIGSILTLGVSVVSTAAAAAGGITVPAALVTAVGLLADAYSFYGSCIEPKLQDAEEKLHAIHQQQIQRELRETGYSHKGRHSLPGLALIVTAKGAQNTATDVIQDARERMHARIAQLRKELYEWVGR
jgi:hypothetical protein